MALNPHNPPPSEFLRRKLADCILHQQTWRTSPSPTCLTQKVPSTLCLRRGWVWFQSVCESSMCLDQWGVLAAVSQLVRDRLLQSTVEALLCSWVTLTMSRSQWTVKPGHVCTAARSMLTQISWTSKVSVPSMFIIPDAQCSLLSVPFHTRHRSQWHTVYRASGITLLQNGITVQISTFCVCLWKHSSSCSVCVIVVLWLLCVWAWEEEYSL